MTNYYFRARELGEYIIQTRHTIRKTAKIFNMAKSTVHYDVSHRLKYVDFDMYLRVKKILDCNFKEKHIRGGMATKAKYKKAKR